MIKYSLEVDDDYEMYRILHASEMAGILFELKHNFHRKWKHAEQDPTIEEVLGALYETIGDIDIDKLNS